MLSRISGRVWGVGLGFLLILVCFRVNLGVALFVPFPRTSGDAPLSFLIGRSALFLFVEPGSDCGACHSEPGRYR